MSDAPEALRLAGVAKTYNRGLPNAVEVLKGLDLHVGAGEVVALVAPSGAGKSTLLHIAGLLDAADAGTVMIGGRDVSALSDRARTGVRRSEIGFVYQFHHLMAEFSAAENVAMPARAAGVPRAEAMARAEALLASVGLGERLTHRPAEMSGGEQQRTALCRALVNRPRLLLADEPTGNLDPETSGIVFDKMIGLARNEGLGALVATHNHALAERMDRVIRL